MSPLALQLGLGQNTVCGSIVCTPGSDRLSKPVCTMGPFCSSSVYSTIKCGATNYITLNHNDGTATLYLHLKYNSVYVGVGQGVSQRQTIGLSGNTGWTGCSAHLHFQRQAQRNWITNAMPVYFNEYPGEQLQAGSSYRSLNYWPGDNCPQWPSP